MYLDSAVIVKLFTAESDSWFYADLVDGRSDIVVSNLSVPECCSAVLRKADHGDIDGATCETALSKIDAFFMAGVGVSVIGVDAGIIYHAAELITQCHGHVPLRTLNSIQIAACMRAEAYPLVTNDRLMRKAAEVLGVPLTPLPA